MRVLLLTRGAPGAGKSTWIERQGLKPYALCPDDLRLMVASPAMTVSGGEAIDSSNEDAVWKLLTDLLVQRMERGDFTVIDATNSKTADMKKYLELCEEYKYRIYCVDFTDVPIETAKERNACREGLKRAPDRVIEKMYARFRTEKVSSKIPVIKPDELDKIRMKKIDLSDYKKIHHIGDIHGCYTALKEYLDGVGGIKDDEYYIFLGDFCDRGIENAEVLEFLLGIYTRPNVCLLEGNHERALFDWADGKTERSKAFELFTAPELERADIDKKEVRKLYRRLRQCAYYDYCGRTYFVCHGGLSALPECLTKVPAKQLIDGVGSFEDVGPVSASFLKNTPENVYQIFGHRNPKFLPIRVNERVYNLEGDVEFGGYLRALQVGPGGVHTEFEIRNRVFSRNIKPVQSRPEMSVEEAVAALCSNRYVREKRFGNISSFNFTDEAFGFGIWNGQTTKARGLYIDTARQKVAARAYDKFFNIGEVHETKPDRLKFRLAFPVTAYVKENGFLGIVSCNENDDSLFVTTKSNPDGEYAGYLGDMLREKVSAENLEKMKRFARDNGVSFVFECVDMKNDPHVIEYPESRLYLLDIIYNDLNYHKFGYEKMCEIADGFGLMHKEKAAVIDCWHDFALWQNEVMKEDYLYNGREIEGFVVEDQNGYMVKLKLWYYNFWKNMRTAAREMIEHPGADAHIPSNVPQAEEFCRWLKGVIDAGGGDGLPRDICHLRKLYLNSAGGE